MSRLVSSRLVSSRLVSSRLVSGGFVALLSAVCGLTSGWAMRARAQECGGAPYGVENWDCTPSGCSIGCTSNTTFYGAAPENYTRCVTCALSGGVCAQTYVRWEPDGMTEYPGAPCVAAGSCDEPDGDPYLLPEQCNLALPTCAYEVCENDFDDDCDGEVNEADCISEVCCNGLDDDRDGETDEGCSEEQCEMCGRTDGQPVDLFLREMRVAPREVARIVSGATTEHDLAFAVSYSSSLAKKDHPDSVGGAADQAPYARVLGPGFRHTFSDRLILQGSPTSPAWLEWESPSGSVRFYAHPEHGWLAEPGISARAAFDATSGTWRVLDERGDIRVFQAPASSTKLHPWSAVTGRYHARLRALHPGGAPRFRFLLLYEDASQGTGFEQLPSGACDGITTGLNTCLASRGLLVRVAAQWLTGASSGYQGHAIELQYHVVGRTPNEYVLRYVRNSTNRADGAATGSLPVLARLNYVENTRPWRLNEVIDRVACADADTQAMCRKVAYDYQSTTGQPQWAVSGVRRSIVNESGSQALGLEELFTWAGSGATAWFVSEHKSAGVHITTSSPPSGGSMTWTRNTQAQATSFDKGMPIQCASGLCGDPSFSRSYATSGPFTLGVAHHRTKDGIDVLRQYNDRGQLIFECEIVTSDLAPPVCTLEPTTGVVTVAAGAVRRAERQYYSLDRDSRRIAVVEQLGNDLAALSPRFPPQNDTAVQSWWTSGSVSLSSCPDLTTSAVLDAATRYYDVKVFDHDSDGDAVLNESSALDLSSFGDWRVARVRRSTQSSSAAAAITSCEVSPYDNQARASASNPERRYYGGAEVARTARSYESTAVSPARTRGRLKTLDTYTDIVTATFVRQLALCASPGNYVDAEGRNTCVEVPQYVSGVAVPLRVEETTSFTGAAWQKTRSRTTSFAQSGGSAILQQFTRLTASGLVVEQGVVGGNFTQLRYRENQPAASTGIKEGRLVNSAGTLIARTVTSHPTTGMIAFPNLIQRYDGAGSLQGERRLQAYTPDGLPGIAEDELGATDAHTEYSYTEWGTPELMIEPDQYAATGGEVVSYSYHASDVLSAGRLKEIRRGPTSSATVVRRFGYTRLGDVQNATGDQISGSVYEHDSRHRMSVERLLSAGQRREYSYDDESQVNAIKTQTPSGTTQRQVDLTHDDAGRLVMRCLNGACSGSNRHLFRYDNKGTGSYVASHNVNGRIIAITNNNQEGRLAYVEDGEGVTFFEYDVVGRVAAVVRHTGALAAFNKFNLTEVQYTYNSASPGELQQIEYPSGRRVRYAYGGDKERPTSVEVELTAGSGTYSMLATNILYHSSGAPKSWQWGASATNTHTVTRDLLGRITRIEDAYNSTVVSRLRYDLTGSYELDGDLEVERDEVAPTAFVTSAATANVTRTHDVNLRRDMLVTWQDHLATRTLTLDTDGRRSSENDGTRTFIYAFSSSYQEQLLSKLWSGGAHGDEALLTWSTIGELAAIDWSAVGGNDITFSHGFLGETQTVTSLFGTYTNYYDGFMHRIRLDTPVTTTKTYWKYGADDRVLEERNVTSTSSLRTETIYLGNDVIGFVVDSGTPTLRHAITDRMGVVRKTKSTAGASVNRLVMDAWGKGTVVADSTPAPALGWRYPGQYEDSVGGWAVLNNRWRSYIPSLGMYTSPEPLHAEIVKREVGPQAYGYASGRPLMNIDPEGLEFFSPTPDFPRPRDCKLAGGPCDNGEFGGGVLNCDLLTRVAPDASCPSGFRRFLACKRMKCIYRTSAGRCMGPYGVEPATFDRGCTNECPA
jgi:RHS repeat-associated protein